MSVCLSLSFSLSRYVCCGTVPPRTYSFNTQALVESPASVSTPPTSTPTPIHTNSVATPAAGIRTPCIPTATGSVNSRRSLDMPSLTRLLHDVKLRVFFQRFVENNYDADGLNFYNAVRDYTQETSVAKAALKAKVIIERFISMESFDTISTLNCFILGLCVLYLFCSHSAFRTF